MAFLTALNSNNRDSRTLPDFSLHLSIPFTFKVRRLDRSMARRVPSITAELAAISLLNQEPMESLQVRGGGLGNSAELQAVFSPVDPLVALACASMHRAVRFARAPNKDIENLFAVAINKRGDGAALNDVDTSALQSETVGGEIANRKKEFDLAGKPGLYCFWIGGIHVGYVAGQERAEMGIDNLRCKFGLVVLFLPNAGKYPPQNQNNKKDTDCRGMAAPG